MRRRSTAALFLLALSCGLLPSDAQQVDRRRLCPAADSWLTDCSLDLAISGQAGERNCWFSEHTDFHDSPRGWLAACFEPASDFGITKSWSGASGASPDLKESSSSSSAMLAARPEVEAHPQKIQWHALARESLLYLAIMHSYR